MGAIVLQRVPTKMSLESAFPFWSRPPKKREFSTFCWEFHPEVV